MVYVDSMFKAKRIGAAGPYWCHMIADTLDELHTMADKIGLKRAWFQNDRFPHYDIGTLQRRNLAISLGAVICDRRTFVGHMQRIRGR